jgi:hypothetical protein
MSRLAFAICAAAVALAPRHVRADGDIVIDVPGERTFENKLLVGGLAGGGLIAGALGVYFHLDSRSAASDVTSDHFTGHAWTAADADSVARADSSKTRAIVAYSLGGALLLGAAVALIVTEPKSTTAVIHPHGRGSPTVAPTEGGAVVGGLWSF